MGQVSSWIPLLRKTLIFSSFTESQLSAIVKRMALVTYPKGAVLFRANDRDDCFYMILSGSVRVLAPAPAPDVPEETLAYVTRGDVLGEMSVLAGEPHANTAVIESSAEILQLKKADFDHLLERNPAIGVHLSRLLSSRLAAFHRAVTERPNPAKIVTLLPSLPARDAVVFAINLAVSIVEQSRRKTLLLFVHEAHDLLTRGLGLDPSAFDPAEVNDEFLRDPGKLDAKLLIHPCGLEVLAMDEPAFYRAFGRSLPAFISRLREHYDLCLVFAPPRPEETLSNLLRESSRVAAVTSRQSAGELLDALRTLEPQMPPGKAMEKIWLTDSLEQLPVGFAPTVRLLWDDNWGQAFLSSGSPFLPPHAKMGQRMIDRLARSFADLRIGLAMGSGAAFGYSLIGVVRILEREGIFPDIISGTSMGALIGSFYAAGLSPDELEEIANSITKGRLWQMADFSFPRSGVIKGNGVLEFLRHHLGDRNFKDLLLPFSCVATDIETGKEIVLDEGNVAHAVRASLSLPFFFQPHYLNGRYLVDGGLVNPVPTSILIQQGANIVLSTNLTSKTGERRVPRFIGWWRRRLPSALRGPSIPEILIKTIYTMQYEIAAARAEISHVVMPIHAQDMLWWDLHRAREIIRMGESVAEENLPKIKALLPFFSDSCRIHLRHRGKKTY